MAERREAHKRAPGVSYKAEAPIYELFISVRSTHLGTTVSLSYSEHRFGDEPLQGHRWEVKDESVKTARSLEHLSNLAGWACRQAARGAWRKVR